jgi:hypothetical protein
MYKVNRTLMMRTMAEMDLTFTQLAARAQVATADLCATHWSLGKAARTATALGVQVQELIYRAPARARVNAALAAEAVARG